MFQTMSATCSGGFKPLPHKNASSGDFTRFGCAEGHRTTRNDGRDGMFVDHLGHGVAQEHHILIERFDLAKLVCDVFDLDAKLLLRSDPPESELFPAAVPVDTSLSNKASKEALGLGPTPLRDLLKALRSELESGTLTAITQPE